MDKPKIVFDSSLTKEKEKKGMLIKKIRALKEITLNTRVQVKNLVENEVADVAFYDEKQFKALLAFGNFVEAKSDESYGRDIPVLLPIEDEVQLEEIPIEVLPNGEIGARKPNEETLKAIKEVETGKTKTAENVEQLFEDLDKPELGDENETLSDLTSIEGNDSSPTSLGEQLEQEYNQDVKETGV